MGLDTIPTGVATGSAGALMGNPVVNVVPALSSLVLAAGIYVLYAVGANVTYQFYDNVGNWNDITAAGVGQAIIYSDGVSFRLRNTNAANQNATTAKIG